MFSNQNKVSTVFKKITKEMKALVTNSNHQKIQCMNCWFNIIIRKNEYGKTDALMYSKNVLKMMILQSIFVVKLSGKIGIDEDVKNIVYG